MNKRIQPPWATAPGHPIPTRIIDPLLVEPPRPTRVKAATLYNPYGPEYPPNGYYPINPDCWCAKAFAPLVAAASPPWNGKYANRGGGALITAQHVIHAAHFPVPEGSMYHFRSIHGVVSVRTIMKSVRAGPLDVQIATLDSPLPVTTFPPCHLLDAPNSVMVGSPCFFMTQRKCLYVANLKTFDRAVTITKPPILQHPARTKYYSSAIRFDSGHPIMTMWDRSRLVVLSHLTDETHGTNYCHPDVLSYIVEAVRPLAPNFITP